MEPADSLTVYLAICINKKITIKNKKNVFTTFKMIYEDK